MANAELMVFSKCKVDGTELVFDKGVTKDDWFKVGTELGKVDKKWKFLLASWYLYGVTAEWTKKDAMESYEEIELKTGIAHQTLKNAVSVANSVPSSVRRSDLSFDHHSIVAPLDPRQQEKLLNQAALNHWSNEKLRQIVAGKEPAISSEKNLSVDEQIAKKLWPLVVEMRGRKLWEKIVKEADEIAAANKRLIFDKG